MTARRGVLPGFPLAMSITLFYLGLFVVLPLGALLWRSSSLSGRELWQTLAAPRALAAYRLSVGTALLAAAINTVCGLLCAWVLVRYRFPGRALFDALVDLPFALPTSIGGIALTTLLGEHGALGEPLLHWLGVRVAFTPLGILVALVFVGLPFVIRAVQPVLADFDAGVEEAAVLLGASRLQLFVRVILPGLFPALLTGFALAFARALGEYGSVVFIAGNMPMKTEIVPLLIMTRLEQYDYAGATALALVMLLVSFTLLAAIHRLAAWSSRRYTAEAA